MRTRQDKPKKPRVINLTDEVWNDFLQLKERDDKSWDLFLRELMDVIKLVKNL